jgi:hypothetical protein
MKFEYTLTLHDYKAAFRLHRQQKLFRRIVPLIGPILLLSALVGFVAFSVEKRIDWAAQCLALGTGALVVTVGLPISRFVSIRKGFKSLFPSGQKERRSAIDINAERIVREHLGANEVKMPWSAVFDFAQDDRITLIYTTKSCFLLFPTGVLSAAQRLELSELVARNVVRR